MKKNLSFVFLVLLFLGLVSCNEKTKEVVVSREDQFIVGLEVNYEPFNYSQSFRSPYNHPVENFPGEYADGYDVQIAKAIAASLGKVLVIQKLEWDALIPQLETKKIDAIIAGMSPTLDRKQSVLFTNCYYESHHVVLIKSDSKFNNSSNLEDFANAKFVGQHGTVYDNLINQIPNVVHQTPLESIPDILTQILANRSDATILELPVAIGIVNKNPEFKYIELTDRFKVLDEEKIVSIALRLSDELLAAQIDGILKSINNDVRTKLMLQAVERANW